MTASFIINDTRCGIQVERSGWNLMKWQDNKKTPVNSGWEFVGHYNTLEGMARRLLQIGASGKVMENANRIAATFAAAAVSLSETIQGVRDGDYLAIVPCASRDDLGCPNAVHLLSHRHIEMWKSGGAFCDECVNGSGVEGEFEWR